MHCQERFTIWRPNEIKKQLVQEISGVAVFIGPVFIGPVFIVKLVFAALLAFWPVEFTNVHVGATMGADLDRSIQRIGER